MFCNSDRNRIHMQETCTPLDLTHAGRTQDVPPDTVKLAGERHVESVENSIFPILLRFFIRQDDQAPCHDSHKCLILTNKATHMSYLSVALLPIHLQLTVMSLYFTNGMPLAVTYAGQAGCIRDITACSNPHKKERVFNYYRQICLF